MRAMIQNNGKAWKRAVGDTARRAGDEAGRAMSELDNLEARRGSLKRQQDAEKEEAREKTARMQK